MKILGTIPPRETHQGPKQILQRSIMPATAFRDVNRDVSTSTCCFVFRNVDGLMAAPGSSPGTPGAITTLLRDRGKVRSPAKRREHVGSGVVKEGPRGPTLAGRCPVIQNEWMDRPAGGILVAVRTVLVRVGYG